MKPQSKKTIKLLRKKLTLLKIVETMKIYVEEALNIEKLTYG